MLDEPQKAIPYLKNVLVIRPKDRTVGSYIADEDYGNLYCAYLSIADTNSLEKLQLDKIKNHPGVDTNANDYNTMGNIYVFRKKYELAKKMYNEALRLRFQYPFTDDVIYNSNLGLAYVAYLLGKDKDALNYIEKAYRAKSKEWEQYILYGIIMMRQGDASSAYIAFKEAKKLHERKWIDDELLNKFFVTD